MCFFLSLVAALFLGLSLLWLLALLLMLLTPLMQKGPSFYREWMLDHDHCLLLDDSN
uniref:Uncharacterized protein n=1 Tax=Rhizophora mucronata TaxID=61149 RepID=A0A2P2QC42_RHIMU